VRLKARGMSGLLRDGEINDVVAGPRMMTRVPIHPNRKWVGVMNIPAPSAQAVAIKIPAATARTLSKFTFVPSPLAVFY
jgi:hypothetical protein